MDDEEAALLAELRAISAKSSASNRFHDESSEPSSSHFYEQQPQQPARNAETSNDNTPTTTTALEVQHENTQRDHHELTATPSDDTALVGEVRAIAEFTRRLSADTPHPLPEETVVVHHHHHRNDDCHLEATTNIASTTTTTATTATASPPAEPTPPPQTMLDHHHHVAGSFQSTIPSTFRGDRGGTAEDAELLAELRAIAAKSSSRFVSDNDNNEENNNAMATSTEAAVVEVNVTTKPTRTAVSSSSSSQKRAATTRARGELPPWKQAAAARPKSQVSVDVPVVSDSSLSSDANGGFHNVDGAETREQGSSTMSTESHRDTSQGGVSTENTLDSNNTAAVQSAITTTEAISSGSNQELPSSHFPVGGFQASVPSTFTGSRGGTAEDAELLAELRAISMKSGSTGRFGNNNDDDDDDDDTEATANDDVLQKPTTPTPPPNVASPPTASVKGSTRSNKNLSASKFRRPFATSTPARASADDDGQVQVTSSDPLDADTLVSAPRQELSAISNNDKSPKLPPWKRGNLQKAQKTLKQKSDNEVMVPPTRESLEPEVPTAQEDQPLSIPAAALQPLLPSTFRGDRGGPAEDEELLAELRAISAKSSSSARFADGSANATEDTNGFSFENTHSQAPTTIRPSKATGTSTTTSNDAVTSKSRVVGKSASVPKSSTTTGDVERSKTSDRPRLLPPWKRGKLKQPEEASGETIAVASNDQSERNTTSPGEVDPSLNAIGTGMSVKSTLPSTFKGDRGGPAEDAELLAELRAISAKSGSLNRFADDSTDAAKHSPVEPVVSTQEMTTVSRKPMAAFRGKRNDQTPNESYDNGTAVGGSLSSNPSVGFGASTSNAPDASTSVKSSQLAADSGITRDMLPTSISDKNWKIRKQSYDLLHALLSEVVGDKEGGADIDANSILAGLDKLVPGMLNDNNATALDSALQFALLYADNCIGAGSPEQAAAIATALTKGPAFAATRPSTVKLCSPLVLKLMEVGKEGASSVHSVTEVLLTHGLTSRKPKVVLTASSLVLDAAYAFGAANLPLAAVSSSASSILAHSNAKVRENGMKVIAEICRSLGSKDPLKDVISEMKSAQASLLDNMLESQPEPAPIGTVLRSAKGGEVVSTADALAAFEAGTKELEARRFAARSEVNVLEEINKTDYNTQIKQHKWSEKVAALEMVITAGGEKPYKLKQPSSTVNYSALIGEMKKLVTHTHFAVAGKSMQVLSMLAEGVGEKLYPHLRPLLTPLLDLSKDKKRTQAVSSCLDSFFGYVLSFEHLLEDDDSIPSSVDERKQKNALVRATALEFLNRSVIRNAAAGPRGQLNPAQAGKIGVLTISKLNDSDATVRKAALELLRSLQSVELPNVNETIANIIEDLKISNPRVFKLVGGTSSVTGPTQSGTSSHAPAVAKPPGTTASKTLPTRSEARAKVSTAATTGSKPVAAEASKPVSQPSPVEDCASARTSRSDDIPSLEDALTRLSDLRLPSWDETEDDGGILAGLQSTKWLSRQNAIKALMTFSKSDGIQASVKAAGPSLLVVVKENTRGFKETNVNVTKAIMELFLALGDVYEALLQPFPDWAAEEAVILALDKVGDKKLSALAKALLTLMCVIHPPSSVLQMAAKHIEKVKSPLPHEELLLWCKYFLTQFGAASIRSAVKNLVPWLLQEGQGTNPKVKKAAMSVIGELHCQSGPIFQAIALSLCKGGALQLSLEATFAEHPFDSSTASAEWPKRCVVLGSANSGVSALSDSTSAFDIPKSDLVSMLPCDWSAKIAAKEGKTAWKTRKEAMDDLEKAINSCSGLLDTSNLKLIVDLLRALRERLSDSQSNLKPFAVRLIGSILAKSDKVAQAKLGKVIYPAVISSALNDNKKPMRDAALAALRSGTTVSDLEGGGPNGAALEFFVIALANELSGSEYKASGIPEVLLFTVENVSFLPSLDDSGGDKFAAVLVECLTSSKSETRSSAEELLNHCLKNNVIRFKSVTKGASRLKPAQQRSVGPIIAKFENVTSGGKEQSQTIDRIKDGQGVPPSLSSRPPQPSVQASRPPPPSVLPNRLGPKREATPERMKSGVAEATSTNVSSHHTRSSPIHPLMGNMSSVAVKKARAAAKTANWPEFPEEPTDSMFLANLKKSWAPLLPVTSVDVLFPGNGVKKQDDGKEGCNLLSRAIAMERSGEGEALIEQMEFVLKWLTCVLCSRESSVGQQALLSLLLELFDFVKRCKYELSDADAAIIVPYLYEKAGFSKGRFREQLMDVIALIETEEVLQAKRLGPTVCVPLMERSLHSKTRLMGYQAGLVCVERIGLSGIGKKGVLVVAKCLSEESLPENRSAALELMNSILSRMNGDIARLSKICGSNLSDKARSMLEAFHQKHGGKQVGTTPNDLSRQSMIPTPTHSRRLFPQGNAHENTTNIASSGELHLSDQLPALQLRYGHSDLNRNVATPTAKRNAGNPFAFSLNAPEPVVTTTYQDPTHVSDASHAYEGPLDLEPEEASGAAATLRARLLKIREKNKLTEPTDVRSRLIQDAEVLPYSGGRQFEAALDTIKELMESSTPILESDPKLTACEKSLKLFHAALSGEPSVDVELTDLQLESLTRDFKSNTNMVVEHLSRIIGFSFKCGPDSITAGISVSLLSVCLATLMSLFRGAEFAKNVSQDSLILLIKETGQALLDPRLASTPQHESVNLDETTSSQLVRAINKLAIQAATGAPRLVALQSLMALLQQLTLQAIDSTTRGRLSRVVAKLFARVVKAETTCTSPFSSIDMGALIVSLEEFLVVCQNAEIQSEDGLATCRTMAKTLVETVMNAKGGGPYMRNLMLEHHIDPHNSPLAALVSSLEETTGYAPSPEKLLSVDSMSSPSSKDVATLVSAIGSAHEGPDRRAAVDALRRYKDVHGDDELNAHLQQVSSAFRSYVLAQLQENTATTTTATSKPLVETNAMSERLQQLRSKLNAAEASVLGAVHTRTGSYTDFDPPTSLSIASSLSSSPSSKSPSRMSTSLAAPAAASVAKPEPAASLAVATKAPSVSSVQSLRERLAAAQENRSRIGSGIASTAMAAPATQPAASSTASTAMGHAAALRARLEAVKRQNNPS